MSESLLTVDGTDKLQQLSKDFQLISGEINSCQSSVSQFGTSADTLAFRSHLDQSITDTTTHLKKARLELIQLDPTTSDVSHARLKRFEARLSQEIDRFAAIVRQINAKQHQFPRPYDMSTARTNSGRVIDTYQTDGTWNNSHVTDTNGKQQQSQQSVVQFQASAGTIAQVEELEKREERMFAILEELQDLKQLMEDLRDLVGDQGIDIDMLDDNVKAAKADVLAGADNLQKAEKNQKSFRKKKCYLLVLLLVIIAICIAVLVPQMSSKKN